MTIKLECDQCKKDVRNKKAYVIDCYDKAYDDGGQINGHTIDTIAFFCSIKCLGKYAITKSVSPKKEVKT